MANDKNKIFELAKEQIKKNNLFFIEDVVAFLPIAKKTFYEYFPIDSDESNDIKSLLEENKIRTKSAIRSKLYQSAKAAELLALYRLICTPEEHQKLNQQYIDHTTKGKEIKERPAIIVADQATKDELDKLLNEADNTD
jgi:hypothetical protein